ncbi:putative peptidoglycan binding protein [Janthinobacterium sp. 35]|uniref:glycoside hydrolase family 108 protein n=1 Tax=Janthinobacterium sp. 35 TaxID=2035210 RepID=UPI000C17F967|nr:glycosyl hydrolase 108 family protein [Janthinobacterium sp. 35]PIG30124.1 putative peptidoglycan binding protein [Janthinobacterium sp. 35]
MKIIDDLIVREGGYSDNPADKGGKTMYGITEAVARASGYAGDMRNLPREFAVAVYTRRYINEPGFAPIIAMHAGVVEELIDTAVNMGSAVPGPWLQRLLNALNQRGTAWPDLTVDGKVGPATLAALAALLKKRGELGATVLLRGLNALQAVRYLEITEARQVNEDFFFGWMANRVGAP